MTATPRLCFFFCLFIICGLSVADDSPIPNLAFCTGKAPSADFVYAVKIYKEQCQSFLDSEAERQKILRDIALATAQSALNDAKIKLQTDEANLAKKSFDEANEKADLTEKNISNLKSLSDFSKGAAPAKVEFENVDAFTSSAQRYLSDLTLDAGRKGGANLIASIDKYYFTKDEEAKLAGALKTSQVTPQSIRPSLVKILILKNADEATTWLAADSADDVTNKLEYIRSTASNVSAFKCIKPANPSDRMKPSFTVPAALFGAQAVLGLANTVASVAQLFTPKLISAAAVTPPANIMSSYIAGLDSVKADRRDIQLVISAPQITLTNAVASKGLQAKLAAETAAADFKKWLELKEKNLTPDEQNCLNTAAILMLDVKVQMEYLVAGSPPSGSLLDRAFRQQALTENGINFFMWPDVITAGGSVTAYQRNSFSSLKLIAGSDIAVATKLFDLSGSVLTIDYRSLGCGRSIPLGSFSEEYSGGCKSETATK